jgi:hypothetical protein
MAPDLELALDSLAAATDEEIPGIIEQVLPLIDYTFFQHWTNRIEALRQAGNTAEAERLMLRRQLIVDTVERFDQESRVASEQAVNLLREVISSNDPESVLEAHKDELGELFLLTLSANIEAGQRAGQQEMVARLEEIQRMTVSMLQEQLPPEVRLLNELMRAESRDAQAELLRTHSAELPDDFVEQLEGLATSLEEQRMTPRAEQVRQIISLIGEVQAEALEEKAEADADLTPEERFINQLVRAADASERSALLRSHASELTTEFVRKLNEQAGEQENEGNKKRAERLRQAAREAAAFLY